MTQPTHSRKILLVVTGLSPQVATETLYALGQRANAQPDAFIPTELHLITTQTGADLAIEGLLEKGHFQALLNDYPQLGNIRFNTSHIRLIRDPQGQPLNDIQTPEENIQAADSIALLLQQFTSQPDTQLHVSLAGGRKTMSFYTGYAFSMYARAHDQLSHVLVTSPFEHQPDFFFPPATPRLITLDTGEKISSDQARVLLTPIPTVRLRSGQPKELLDGSASFSETVNAIQESFAPPSLSITLSKDKKKRSVFCGGHSLKLQPAEIAWLAWWANQTQRNTPYCTVSEFQDKEELRVAYAKLYKHISAPGHTSGFEKRILGSDKLSHAEAFRENTAKVNKAIEEQLPVFLHRHYKIIEKEDKGASKGEEKKRALNLSPENITLKLID